jgi:hypothetical protein
MVKVNLPCYNCNNGVAKRDVEVPADVEQKARKREVEAANARALAEAAIKPKIRYGTVEADEEHADPLEGMPDHEIRKREAIKEKVFKSRCRRLMMQQQGSQAFYCPRCKELPTSLKAVPSSPPPATVG